MKKYIITMIIAIALLATFVMPDSGVGVKAVDITDNFSDLTVSTYLSDINRDDKWKLDTPRDLDDNGYMYILINLRPASHIGDKLYENIILEPFEGDLSNIASVEYQVNTGDAWNDAYSTYINNEHLLQTSSSSHQLLLRLEFTGDITFTYQYKVTSEDRSSSYSTKKRYIRVSEGQALFTQKPGLVTTAVPSSESTSEVTTVDPSTESTSEVTTVAPSSESTSEATTVAPSTESTSEATTVAPSTETTTKATTAAPSTQPTTKVVTTAAPTTTEEPITQETASVDPSVVTTVQPESTPDVTKESGTKGKVVKKPGKAKIKKVWKKKRSAKKVKIKLKAVKGAKGYKVFVYKNKKSAKKHKKAIVTKFTSKTKYTIKSKKLAKKKKLFIRVRAYNIAANGKKQFGAWSKIKKVKIK